LPRVSSAQKTCLDEYPQDVSASAGFQSPETLGLGTGETKPRHLEELVVDATNVNCECG
jgi:hypothetical protein